MAGRGGVPCVASAVVLNVTVTRRRVPGFVTVFPCGSRAGYVESELCGGSDDANAVVATVSVSGEVCFYVYGTANLIVDVTGYFPTGSGFVPLSPSRVLDTRVGGVEKVGNAAGTACCAVMCCRWLAGVGFRRRVLVRWR